MRFGIISDIHGNYPALKAVIEDAFKNKVDSFIFTGDYIFDLPYSNEVTELIKNMENAFIIQGNKEGYLKKLSEDNQADWIYEQMGALYQTFRELKTDNLSFLMNLPKTCYVPLQYDKNIYVTHYINELGRNPKKTSCSSSKFREQMEKRPFSHKEFLDYIDMFLNEEESLKILNNINASVIILGHSHLQWHGYSNGKLVINPGSCGQPLDFNNKASYTILEYVNNEFLVDERRVFYDIEETIRNAENTLVYKKGEIWCKLVFSALRNARDNFSLFFGLAEKLALENNESGKYFSNKIWNQTANLYWNKQQN